MKHFFPNSKMKLDFKIYRDKNIFKIKKIRISGSDNVWFLFKNNDQRLSRHLEIVKSKIYETEFINSHIITLNLEYSELKYYYDSDNEKFIFFKKELKSGLYF